MQRAHGEPPGARGWARGDGHAWWSCSPGVRPVAEGLATALVRLEGPVMVSRGGKAEGKPWPGPALVAFGAGELPERGRLRAGARQRPAAAGLRGGRRRGAQPARRAGRPRAGAARAWRSSSSARGCPRVAGGPADPGAWDRWFGELNAFAEGEGEAKARAKKAAALHPSLAALYREVRTMRESRAPEARAPGADRPRRHGLPGRLAPQDRGRGAEAAARVERRRPLRGRAQGLNPPRGFRPFFYSRSPRPPSEQPLSYRRLRLQSSPGFLFRLSIHGLRSNRCLERSLVWAWHKQRTSRVSWACPSPRCLG